MIRILLVDDQKTIRENLRIILESAPDLQVIGTASDGHTAIEQVSYLKPDVVLIDMEMPGLDGVSATQVISQRFSHVKVLVLSMHDDEALIAKSTHAGAMGYLLKNTPPQELRAAIRFVQLGYPQYGPGLLGKVVAKDAAEGNGHLKPYLDEAQLYTSNGNGTSNGHSNGNGNGNSHINGNGHSNGKGQVTPPLSEALTSLGATYESTLAESTELSTPDRSPHPQNGAPLAEASLGALNAESLEFKPLNADSPGLWKKYLILGLLINGLLWAISISFLVLKRPLYTSSWTLDLPAARSDTVLEVPGVGRAAQSNDSPYSNYLVADPRSNYKDLLQGSEISSATAKRLRVPTDEFDPPRVEVVANTTLIKLAITGPSPREAQQRAIAFQEAFDAKLNTLRKQELAQQNKNLKAALDAASERLRVTQQRLSDYKVQSGLDSGDQLRDLSTNIEALRRQRAEIVGRMEDSANQLQQLSSSLGLSTPQAADAFVLQSDALFQQYLLGYSKTSAELSNLESAYSVTHPRVVDKAEENSAARTRMLQRGQQLLGHAVDEATLKQINVSNGISTDTQRSDLFQKMITLRGEQEGFKGQSAALDQQIERLEGMMTTLSKKKSILVNLERDVQIAEAIFTSTLGKLDLTKSSFSAAYPQVTVRTQPNRPKLPSSPKIVPTLAGTAFASILLCSGLATLWWRDRRLYRLRMQKAQGEFNIMPSPALQASTTYPSLPGHSS